jgi:transposase
MTIVAESHDFVIGVDTHARTHTYAVVAAKTGQLTAVQAFPVTGEGIIRALDWVENNTTGRVLFSVEGTSSYGASLTRALQERELVTCETRPPRRQSHAGQGKSDQIDAAAAAHAALGLEEDQLIHPRANGLRQALRVLLDARRDMDSECTRARNRLNALARTTDLGIDARKALTDPQIRQIGSWDTTGGDLTNRVLREEASRLAANVLTLTRRLVMNRTELVKVVHLLAPGLLNVYGVGPVTAGIMLAAYSHHGRIRNQAAFAALAGVAPIPASSGNTIRHRLNRYGDRQLNYAFDVIARVRISHDPHTRDYVTKRTSQGRTHREIRRALKRYIARELFKTLERLAITT